MRLVAYVPQGFTSRSARQLMVFATRRRFSGHPTHVSATRAPAVCEELPKFALHESRQTLPVPQRGRLRAEGLEVDQPEPPMDGPR